MANRIVDDRDLVVEFVSAVLAAIGQIAFASYALWQSGGLVLHRVVNDGWYHTDHTLIIGQLALSVGVIVLIELAAGLWSWKKKLNIMRVVLPACVLMFAGIMCQAYLNPTNLLKHLLTVLVGIALCAVWAAVMNMPIGRRAFNRICVLIIPASLVCLVVGLLNMRNGNGSWVFGIQLGEFYKIGLLVLSCTGWHHIRTDKTCRCLFFLAAALMVGSVLAVRDLGNFVIAGGLFIVVLLSLGMRLPAAGLTAIGAVGGVGMYKLAGTSGRIYNRVSQSLFYPLTHLITDPNTDRTLRYANQNLRQGLFALIRGGVAGTGTAGSNALYASNVYAARTDFTFVCGVSIFGAVFGVLIIAAFIVLTVNVTVSLKKARAGHQDVYQANIISCLFLIQAVIHCLGSLSLIPMTGVTLPFISAGGSSMTASFVAVGALLGLYMPDGFRRAIAAWYTKASSDGAVREEQCKAKLRTTAEKLKTWLDGRKIIADEDDGGDFD